MMIAKKIMAKKTLQFISTKMKNLDLCMLTTKSSRGILRARPMSNNGDVKYDGNSYFFTWEDSQKVKDITRDSSISLSFATKDYLFIHVAGKARIIRARAIMKEHWADSLREWFKDGLDTQGMVLIAVKAVNIKYWHKMEEGEVKL